MTDNRQYSECGDFKSSFKFVKTGLMQGSILSPKLFNVYSCDMNLMDFKGRYYGYADDICFEHFGDSIDEIEHDVNEDMKKFEIYMNSNFLTVNVKKSCCMTIGHSNSKVSVHYAGQPLEQVNEFRYLGLTISKNLDWNAHVQKLCRSLSALAGVFYKISNVIPLSLKKPLYNSMFVSSILYCLPIYGSTSNSNVTSVQRCQNRAIKNLFAKDRYYSPIRLLNDLNLMTFMNYYRLFSTNHIHSINRNSIHSNITLTNVDHNYHTRQRERGALWKPSIHTKKWGEDNPYVRGIDLYNDLELPMKNETNMKVFKKNLRQNLLDVQKGT